MRTTKPLFYLSAGIAVAATAAIAYGLFSKNLTSQRPEQCESATPFLEAHDFKIREQFLKLTSTYDLITDGNCDVGTIEREFMTFTRKTHIDADGKSVGEIDTKVLSLGYDMTVYDENGRVISTIDHKLLDSALNFGGYYIEISDPSGEVIGTLKQDPFAFWKRSNWKYFEVLSPEGDVVAKIEYIAVLPDTYRIVNISDIDNRTLAGLVSILDQIEDEASSSSSSSSSSD